MTDQDAEGGEAEAKHPRAGAGEASEKQRAFITALVKRIGLADEELEKVLDAVAQVKAVADLDRRGASAVIDELQIVGKERGVDLDAQPVASDKQVGFMKQLKRRAHLTDDEFAAFLEERAGVSTPEEVGRRDASTIIDELLKRADGKPGAAPAPKPVGGKTARAPASKPAGKAPARPAGGAAGTKAPKVLAGGKARPRPRDEDEGGDDDRPPDREPPPRDIEAPDLVGFDGPTPGDLERDPGSEGEGDDLPF